ncbi:MAG: hypothetical protein ACEQSD_07400 [Flavobacteriales bacterium]
MIGFRGMLPRLAVCLLLGAVISQGSCSKQPAPHIPQEGELVTWYMTPELVIRTRLGERREHIVGKHDAEFYRPHFERYIGQFPIDYQPESLEKISVAELKQWSADPMSITDAIEFNLMLNGSKFTATDANIAWSDGLDHVDQVKVEIQRRGIGDTWTDSTVDDYKQLKARKGLGEYDEDFSSRYRLDCYIYPNKAAGRRGRICYGQSLNPKISALKFEFMSDSWIFIRAHESIYGGLKVKVRFDHSNLAQWQDIDAAIWRLLDAWNVSPETSEIQTQQPYQPYQ